MLRVGVFYDASFFLNEQLDFTVGPNSTMTGSHIVHMSVDHRVLSLRGVWKHILVVQGVYVNPSYPSVLEHLKVLPAS